MSDRLTARQSQPLTPPAKAPAASPCTDVCRIDAASGWCEGCLRSLDEIAAWSALDEAARAAVCAGLALRRAALAAREPNSGNAR